MVNPSIVKIDSLLTQNQMGQLIGAARMLKLRRCGWLAPVSSANGRAYKTAPILYSVRNLRQVIRRLERGELPPPDSVATVQVRASETRHRRAYIRKTNVDVILDFESIDFTKLL
jgi:broad specificity phosphatase PhoE